MSKGKQEQKRPSRLTPGVAQAVIGEKGPPLAERPLPREVSAVPAELLRLAGGLLGNPDVDEGRAAEVHRLLQGALQVLRLLDQEALAAESLLPPPRPSIGGTVTLNSTLAADSWVIPG